MRVRGQAPQAIRMAGRSSPQQTARQARGRKRRLERSRVLRRSRISSRQRLASDAWSASSGRPVALCGARSCCGEIERRGPEKFRLACAVPHPLSARGSMSLRKRATAEFIGTFWLVLRGCGSGVLAAAFPNLGIGFLGVALAFGLTVLTMAYAIGHISGCHLNPAVTVGLWAGKRFPLNEILPYIGARVLGAILGTGILYSIASGKKGFTLAGGFASNGF